MKSETGDIRRELKVSFVKLSVEEYLPDILKGYGQYTLYVCENCGKLEVFLKKARAIVGKKKAGKALDESSSKQKRSHYLNR